MVEGLPMDKGVGLVGHLSVQHNFDLPSLKVEGSLPLTRLHECLQTIIHTKVCAAMKLEMHT